MKVISSATGESRSCATDVSEGVCERCDGVKQRGYGMLWGGVWGCGVWGAGCGAGREGSGGWEQKEILMSSAT